MSRTLLSPQHKALRAFLVQRRKRAGLTQTALAERLGRYQSYVANVETGQKRLDVVEFIAFAKALGFDPAKAISKIASVKP
jgi:transcriptional regulator with XRE-family HTH domain